MTSKTSMPMVDPSHTSNFINTEAKSMRLSTNPAGRTNQISLMLFKGIMVGGVVAKAIKCDQQNTERSQK